MRRQDHVTLNNHVSRFDPRVEQHRVRLGIGYVRGVTSENASVIRFTDVGITNPVKIPINKVNTTGFIP